MSWSLVVREGSPTAGEEKEVDDDEVDSLISCLEREEVSYVTKLLTPKNVCFSVRQILQCVYLFSLVCVCCD